MTKIVTMISVACVLAAGLFLATQSTAIPTQPEQTKVDAPAADTAAPAETLLAAKRCSTSSDCPGSKCSGGQCGACSTSSDCKYGKCSSSKCGACSTSSDCGGWGKCSSGQCGACSTSSDCGSFGSCSSGRCANSPY
jgi:hypothetical protein